MRAMVITYCETSKKIPKCYWHNIKKKKKTDRLRRWLRLIPVNFLWKPWGCLWPPSALGRRGGGVGRRGSESMERVLPLRTQPIHWDYLMLSLSRQEGQRDKLRLSPDLPLNEVQKVTKPLAGEGWKACRSPWLVTKPSLSGAMCPRECGGRGLRLTWAPKPSFYP